MARKRQVMSSVVPGPNLKCCSEGPPGTVRVRGPGPYLRHAERAATGSVKLHFYTFGGLLATSEWAREFATTDS